MHAVNLGLPCQDCDSSLFSLSQEFINLRPDAPALVCYPHLMARIIFNSKAELIDSTSDLGVSNENVARCPLYGFFRGL